MWELVLVFFFKLNSVKIFVSDSLTVFCNHTTLVISARERDGGPRNNSYPQGPQYVCTTYEYCNLQGRGVVSQMSDGPWLIKLDLIKGFRKRYSICNKLLARSGPGAHLERLFLSSHFSFIISYWVYRPPLRPLRAPCKALSGKIIFLSFFFNFFAAFLAFQNPLEPYQTPPPLTGALGPPRPFWATESSRVLTSPRSGLPGPPTGPPWAP